MKSRCLCLLLGLMACLPCNAQQRPDSMLKKLQELKEEDTMRAKLLFKIGTKYESFQPDSAIYFLRAADTLSDKLAFDRGKIRCLVELSYMLTVKNRFAESMELCRQGEVLGRKMKEPAALRSIYINMALNFSGNSRFDSCLFYYLRALPIAESMNDPETMITINGNLSGVYQKLHQPEKGYQHGLKAIELCRKLNYEDMIATPLTNAAVCLYDMRRYDEAEQYFDQAIEITTRKGNDVDRIPALLNLDNIYKSTGRYNLIPGTARTAIALAAALGDKSLLCVGFQDLAFYQFTQKRFDSALIYANQSLDTAAKNNLLTPLADAYQMIGNIALLQGRVSDYLHYNVLHDSALNESFSTQIAANTQEMEARYESVKKENRIQQQAGDIRRSRLLTALLAASLLAAVVIILLSLRSYRNRQKLLVHEQQLADQKIKQLEQEKQLTATEAVLNAQDEERTRMARDLHDGLGGMLSGIKFSFINMKDNMIMTPEQQVSFTRSLDMLDTSIGELRRVAHNMMPESLIKFGLDAALNDMCQYINSTGVLAVASQTSGLTAAAIDKNISINVYRIVQELLNNVIRHSGATEAILQVMLSGGQYSITVEDNGHGFPADGEHKGMGLGSIRNRVNYLNGIIDIKSSPEKGTSVLIEFKALHV